MNKTDDVGRFIIGLLGGVILGALISNMAIGLLIGLVLGFGLFKMKRRG